MYKDPDSSLPFQAHPATHQKPLRVGLLGIGTVGHGTYQVLQRNRREIEGRAGRAIEVTMVAARDLARAATRVDDGVTLVTDPMAVVNHPDIDVVVEVVGGTSDARLWVLQAIANGKHVVTANKALLAVHGSEIFAAARQHGVMVAFEGAVAVSIPIIKALREGLTANRIEWVAGIINGTTNFILSAMRDSGLSFAAALAQAQALGYAEADPSFDIEGVDAAHKATLLAAIAFGIPVQFNRAHIEGISQLQALDIACAERLGYRVKLLGIARRQAAGIELRVHPALVPAQHLLAQVEGAMNGVMVKGDAAGLTLYCGAGAGSEQTASAVIADLVDVARLADAAPSQRVPHLAFQHEAMADTPILPMDDVCTRYYLRVPLKAGASNALAAVSRFLAQGGIPLESISQAPADLAAGNLIVLTHEAREQALQATVAAIGHLPQVLGPVVVIRLETLA